MQECSTRYAAWLDRLFALAPDPPSCRTQCEHLEKVRSRYENAPHSILLRHDNSSGRSSASATSLHRRPLPGAAHRAKVVAAMFNEARRRGALPPHLEMIVSVADKPRLSPPRAPRFGLPIFSWVTEYGLGSGNPAAWTGALPFPTWFNCGPTAPPWQRGSWGLPARGASSKVYGPSSSFEAGGAE